MITHKSAAIVTSPSSSDGASAFAEQADSLAAVTSPFTIAAMFGDRADRTCVSPERLQLAQPSPECPT